MSQQATGPPGRPNRARYYSPPGARNPSPSSPLPRPPHSRSLPNSPPISRSGLTTPSPNRPARSTPPLQDRGRSPPPPPGISAGAAPPPAVVGAAFPSSSLVLARRRKRRPPPHTVIASTTPTSPDHLNGLPPRRPVVAVDHPEPRCPSRSPSPPCCTAPVFLELRPCSVHGRPDLPPHAVGLPIAGLPEPPLQRCERAPPSPSRFTVVGRHSRRPCF